MSDLTEIEIFAIVGVQGFVRLTAAFFARVGKDDILSEIYPKEDLAGAEERLLGFLIQRFGGPDDYSRQRGHPRLRMRHNPFVIDHIARDRWVHQMEAALDEAKFPDPVARLLRHFFDATATFMINRS